MRTLSASIVSMIAFLAALPAMGTDTSSAKLPDDAQIMHQQVGGTHIPQPTKPQNLVNPYEGDARAIAEGRAYFNAMNCSGCHAALGGGGMGPPLSDNDWIYGGAPGQIYLSILQGRPNGMPSFEKALPPDAIWKLVSYVRTLSQTPSTPVPAPAQPRQTGKAD